MPVDVDDQPAQTPAADSQTPQTSATGTWQAIDGGPLVGRRAPAAVWTGREMLVWGGLAPGGGPALADGAAYDPRRDHWRELPPAPVAGRGDMAAVWTGTELVVWGGSGGPEANDVLRDGAAYDPRRDRWRRLPPGPLTARRGAEAVWTGTQVVVWGGFGAHDSTQRADGARWDPAANRWRPMAQGPLVGRTDIDVTLQPLDGKVFVWSSSHAGAVTAMYDPDANDWRRLRRPPLRPGSAPAFVATGGAIMAWGQAAADDPGESEAAAHGISDGPVALRYTSDPDWWAVLAEPPFAPRGQRPVAAGSAVLAYEDGTGALFDIVADRWLPMSTGPTLGPGPAIHLWANDRLLIWHPGGDPDDGHRGATWSRSDPWQPLDDAPVPLGDGMSALWTGWVRDRQQVWGANQPQVLLWGGIADEASDLGAAFDTGLRVWENVPSGPLGVRFDHAAAWTGTEMIVAGGRVTRDGPSRTDVAAYDPTLGEWRALPDAPLPVRAEGAAWSGRRLYAAANDDDGVAVAALDPQTQQWDRLPAPPLPGAADPAPIVLWAGYELWVLASHDSGYGDVQGAAWSPRRGLWRRLAPLEGVWAHPALVWTGGRMFAVDAQGNVASLDNRAQQWTGHPPAPVHTRPALAWTGRVIVAYDVGRRRLAGLDPRASSWVEAPPPALPAALEASLVWTGRELYAFARGEAAVLGP